MARRGGWRRPARGASQRGFTLVELMVAMVVSALLVGMILSIFTRMSAAYRAQQNIAELQQTLAAAQEMIQRDLRQAGYQVSNGFRWAGAPVDTIIQPIQVTNNANGFGPDEIRIYAGDGSAQARVLVNNNGVAIAPFTQISVDDVDLFTAGDLALFVVAYDSDDDLPNGAARYRYEACVVRVAGTAGNLIQVDTAPPWGTATNAHCDATWDRMGLEGVSGMLYRFRARAYRIDPARRNLAVLQLSPSGGLVAGDWQDLGVGFTDLQVATRWNDYWDDGPAINGAGGRDEADTNDPDTDPLLDWYSSEEQEALTAPVDASAFVPPTARFARPVASEARVSLVVRTLKRLDSVPTAATPVLVDSARVTNNDLGDRAAVQLEGVPDASRPAELRGDAVYRHATIGSDLRNLAVGQ